MIFSLFDAFCLVFFNSSLRCSYSIASSKHESIVSTKDSIFSVIHLSYLIFKITLFFFSESRYFQNHVIFKTTLFSKLRYFQNHVIFKITLFSKPRYFQNYVIFKITLFFQNSVLLKITLFFKTSVFFKKFPVQSSSAIPHKNSMFFQKIPRLKNY